MTAAFHFESQLSPAQLAAWQRFLDATPRSHPTQLPDWGAFLQVLGYRPWYFFVADADRWRMVSLCAARSIPGTRKVFCELTRGPVADDPATLREFLPVLVDALRRQRAAVIRIKPLWAAEPLADWLRASGWQPRHDESHHTLEIDLRQSIADIPQQFKATVRYEIRRAQKIGVEVSPATTDAEFAEWFALYERMCAGKGVGLPNPRFHRAQWDTWLKLQRLGVLLVARYEGRLLAGSVVMRDAHRCVYFYGASVERIAGVPLGEPLQWHAIQWAKRQGCAVYDLGGYHPHLPADSPLLGVDRFKLGFAHQPVEYLPAHELVLDPVACAVWKAGKKIAPRVRALLKR